MAISPQPFLPVWALAVFGFVAHEIVRFWYAVQKTPGRCPVRYKSWPYLLSTLLVAIAAGVVAGALGVTEPIKAIALGVAVPRLLISFEKGGAE